MVTAGNLPADAPRALTESSSVVGRGNQPARVPPRSLLAPERVRFVGDSVALVLAETRIAAMTAAENVAVEYEEMPAVVDGRAALAPGAPQVWDSIPGNLALDWTGGDETATDRAFVEAAHVTRLELVNNRVVIAPMETRGVLAYFDPGSGRYTLHVPCQGVDEMRIGIAAALGVPQASVHVLTRDVGGAFGMKIFAYPEYPLLAWAARWQARPIKWIGERADAFVTDGHGRDHVTHAELALDPGGRFLAIRCDTVSNIGAFGCLPAYSIPTVGGTRCITGVYAIPAWHATVRVACTNTTPVVAYRGAGKPEYNYAIERLVDTAARELEIDPAELRRRNVVAPEAMPYDTGTGLVFDCGEFAANMDDALGLADRNGFENRRATSGAAGRLRGFGFALFQEPDGYLHQRVTMRLDRDAHLTVTTTGMPAGQGHWTTFAQVAAEQLGIPVRSVRLIQGDSDAVGPGLGSGGSRSATVTGGGIARASEQIIDKAKRIAGQLMEASPADIEFGEGTFRIAGTDREMSLATVAAAAYQPLRLPPDMEPGLEARSHYLARGYNYPCGCHVCEVEIDPDTGSVRIEAYVAVNDHGIVINPLLLEGQVHGGIVQGIGQAMLEHCVYDSGSGQLLAGSFMDYCLPRATNIPSLRFERNEVPTDSNPLGVKGVGESGCTAALPAVINAIVDALVQCGVDSLDMPATPGRIWEALVAANSDQS